MAKTNMHWTERAISTIAPGWALKRHTRRMALETLGKRSNFDALAGGRLRGDFSLVTQDADAANITSLKELRNHVRNLRRNSGLVSGPIRRTTNNVIGTGITPQARVKATTRDDDGPPISPEQAKTINYQAEKRWGRFAQQADAHLRMTIYEQMALAFSTMFGDGECLVVQRSSSWVHRMIPLSLEVMEIDRLDTPPEELKNPSVRNGIRFNAEGIPVSYFVNRYHPGSNLLRRFRNDDFEEIPSYDSKGRKQVHHLFDINRPGQTRGYTMFAAGLADMNDLKRYMEAEVVAARVAACLAAFITSPNADEFQAALSQNTDTKAKRITEFEPGMISYLRPGEDVRTTTPGRPNPAMGEFIRQIQRGQANAIDLPYEFFTGDWQGMNYSNARTVLLQAYLSFRIYQSYMINHFCLPVWESFFTDCFVKGLINAPGFNDHPENYLKVRWIPNGWKWVDPLKEAEGARVELESQMTSLSDIYAGKGQDWEEQLEQIALELKKKKELEEENGISFAGAEARESSPLRDSMLTQED